MDSTRDDSSIDEKQNVLTRMRKALKTLRLTSGGGTFGTRSEPLWPKSPKYSPPNGYYTIPALPDESTSQGSLLFRDCEGVHGGQSVVSASTYYTALSRPGAKSVKVVPGQLREDDQYAQLLKSEKLWPVLPDIEQDWSGRGQHAEFQKREEKGIKDILQVQDTLGHTRTALVQSVKCRRILLARKTITCGKASMTREEAIKEVAHLNRLAHAHIVRVIGTYVHGRHLSILLYPVAQFNLESFSDEIRATVWTTDAWTDMAWAASKFYGCLCHAVQYIHSNLTKHMDIKPQNILVHRLDKDPYYRPFLADFGIARSYHTSEDIETDGGTPFTRRYAAPEVVRQDVRGLPADIFSLGCVFIEIYTVFQSPTRRDHMESTISEVLDRNECGDRSYSANVKGLQELLMSDLGEDPSWAKHVKSTVSRMISLKPKRRPSALTLSKHFSNNPCCSDGPLPLQAMESGSEEGHVEKT